jgi:hypothetical protein
VYIWLYGVVLTTMQACRSCSPRRCSSGVVLLCWQGGEGRPGKASVCMGYTRRCMQVAAWQLSGPAVGWWWGVQLRSDTRSLSSLVACVYLWSGVAPYNNGCGSAAHARRLLQRSYRRPRASAFAAVKECISCRPCHVLQLVMLQCFAVVLLVVRLLL